MRRHQSKWISLLCRPSRTTDGSLYSYAGTCLRVRFLYFPIIRGWGGVSRLNSGFWVEESCYEKNVNLTVASSNQVCSNKKLATVACRQFQIIQKKLVSVHCIHHCYCGDFYDVIYFVTCLQNVDGCAHAYKDWTYGFCFS
jgi:hypothetical protein